MGEIKDLLKEQNRQLETGSAGKGSAPSSSGFKPMSAKDTGLTAVMIIGIAAALVGAAAIFTFIPVISQDKLLTALAVAAIMLLISPVFVMIANILGKTYDEIFSEFEGLEYDDNVFAGDVKYHLGASGFYQTFTEKKIRVSLASNPSHLEFVDPVVEGVVRAKQIRNNDLEKNKN